MTVLCKYIINHLEKFCPKSLALDWDNVGLLVGDKEQEIKKVLVALDVTEDVINEAIENDINLIVTHHPLFNPKWGGPIRSITKNSPFGILLYKLIQNNISLYSAHTNLDIAQGGVNDTLSYLLGMTKIVPFENEGQALEIGRVGELEKEIKVIEFINIIKEKLGLDKIRFIGNLQRNVKKVAVCSGSGADLIEIASLNNVDILITGDVKYHDAQKALALGLNVVDAGHYETEVIIVPVLKAYLQKLGGLDIIESRVNGSPFKLL